MTSDPQAVDALLRRCDAAETRLAQLRATPLPATAAPARSDTLPVRHQREIAELRQALHLAERRASVLEGSFSWRMTAIVRAVARWLGKPTTDSVAHGHRVTAMSPVVK